MAMIKSISAASFLKNFASLCSFIKNKVAAASLKCFSKIFCINGFLFSVLSATSFLKNFVFSWFKILKITTSCILIFLVSGCLNGSRSTNEKIMLENRLNKLESDMNLLSKKVDKLLIVNEMYSKYLSQIDSSNIVDIYNTEIALGGIINITPNINTDYNLAILALKYNHLDNALEILLKIKQNLKSAILAEIELQKNISIQINSQGDDDGDDSSFYSKKDFNQKDKNSLSKEVSLANFRPINESLNPKSLSLLSKSLNKNLVFDIERLKFFYRAIFEVNYLIGYIYYAKQDFKNAVSMFLENNNIDDENAKFIDQNQFLTNIFSLGYSFTKIGRNDKFCELSKISKITDKRIFNDQQLYEKIISSMPTISCSEISENANIKSKKSKK